MAGDSQVHVDSGFGARERKPFVRLRVKDVFIQVTPAKAALIGAWLIEASSAAISDAAVVEMGGGEKLTTQETGQLLMFFRSKRSAVERALKAHDIEVTAEGEREDGETGG